MSSTTKNWRVAKQIAGLLVVALLMGTWMAFVDKVYAAPASADSASRVCSNDDGTSCQRKAVKRKVAQFKAGELGNSKGFRLPRKVRRMIALEVAQTSSRTEVRDGGGEWWRAPLTRAMCIGVSRRNTCGPGSDAAEDSADLAEKVERSSEIAVKCGGAAIIGSFGLKGGGTAYWGAGKGALACLWATFLARAWGW
jgi:hypothetical protein